jgi:ADP-dependent NAD(P)H-hydrate dehydratase
VAEAGGPVVVSAATLREWPLPDPASDKESRGRVLAVGGGTETPGAVLLAGEAALRAGAGKLQMAVAESVAPALALAVPESRAFGLPAGPAGVLGAQAAPAVLKAAEAADVVLLGPGCTDLDATVELLEEVVPRLDATVVLDALATAYVTEHPDGLGGLTGRCVLTANPTEVARMLGREDDEVEADPAAAAVALAGRTRAVVLCGGADKVVAAPDGSAWRVEAGGPGLGASGSGDVQAGLVAGLLARGAEPAQAAVWGAWLHGTAGDRLASSSGPIGFLVRDLAAHVPGLVAEVAG